jgi:hypothetical protein
MRKIAAIQASGFHSDFQFNASAPHRGLIESKLFGEIAKY